MSENEPQSIRPPRRYLIALAVACSTVACGGDGQAAGLGVNALASRSAYLNLGTAVVGGVYSPDGRRIAYCQSEGPNTDIWVMNASDGGGRVNLTNAAGSDLSPIWSPDGTQIAYGRRAEDDQDLGLWIVKAAGGTPRSRR